MSKAMQFASNFVTGLVLCVGALAGAAAGWACYMAIKTFVLVSVGASEPLFFVVMAVIAISLAWAVVKTEWTR